MVEDAPQIRPLACGWMDVRPRPAGPAREPVRFTQAEAWVLPLLATYLTLSGIADRLGVGRSTVKTHVVKEAPLRTREPA